MTPARTADARATVNCPSLEEAFGLQVGTGIRGASTRHAISVPFEGGRWCATFPGIGERLTAGAIHEATVLSLLRRMLDPSVRVGPVSRVWPVAASSSGKPTCWVSFWPSLGDYVQEHQQMCLPACCLHLLVDGDSVTLLALHLWTLQTFAPVPALPFKISITAGPELERVLIPAEVYRRLDALGLALDKDGKFPGQGSLIVPDSRLEMAVRLRRAIDRAPVPPRGHDADSILRIRDLVKKEVASANEGDVAGTRMRRVAVVAQVQLSPLREAIATDLGSSYQVVPSWGFDADSFAEIHRIVGTLDAVVWVIGPSSSAANLHDARGVERRWLEASIIAEVLTIPVIVADGTMPPRSELPPELRELADRQAIVWPAPGFDRELLGLLGAGTPAGIHDVFISYRRIDALPEALALRDGLEGAGVKVFLDQADLPAGRPFPGRLDEAVARSRMVLAVVGPGWYWHAHGRYPAAIDDADWVARELEVATCLEIPVLPVLVRGGTLPPMHRLPRRLRRLRLPSCALEPVKWPDTPVERLSADLLPA